MPAPEELVEHLFRHQAGRMVSTLTRILGPRNLQLAEDVVQEALVRALELWPHRGIPANPSAWLIEVARNRALDVLRREASLAAKADELTRVFSAAIAGAEGMDDQLALRTSGDSARGPRRAYAQDRLRLQHVRNRARLSDSGTGRRAAHRPRQAHGARPELRAARGWRTGRAP